MKKFYLSEQPHLKQLRLALRRINHGVNREMYFHEHDSSETAIVLDSGGTEHFSNGGSAVLKRGDVILMHPGIIHAYAHTEKLELVNLIYNAEQLPLPQLDGAELKELRAFIDPAQHIPHPEKPIVHLDDLALREVEMLLAELEKELKKPLPGQHLCGFGLFIAILVRMARAGGAAEATDDFASATKALHYLNLHFREDVTADWLAKFCSLSRTSFFQRFHRLTGCSPLEYRQKKRLDLAAELLHSTNRDLSDIAEYCGFYDSNHLIRLFSRRNGVTPGKFRKNTAGASSSEA